MNPLILLIRAESVWQFFLKAYLRINKKTYEMDFYDVIKFVGLEYKAKEKEYT